MYNVILWKDNDNEDIHVFKNKPTFSELYKLIGCDLIEIIQGYNDEDKTFDMYSDEEAKLKNINYPNKRATKAWYAWQEKTGFHCMPGDHIAGTVAIVKKQKFKLKEING